MINEADSKMVPPPHNEADVKMRGLIDRSARFPVLFFFTSSVVWLVVASVLGFITTMKAHWPVFLDFDFAFFLNYGRVRPAFLNALVYGWAIQAGLGVVVWLMARLCRTEIKNPLTLIIAGHFWNAGVLIGTVAILAGFGTGFELMDFPKWVWPILLVAYSMIAIWMITMFQRRRTKGVYISQWYILGACFWFPWAYLTANVFVFCLPGSSVMAAGVNVWFQSALLFLVLTPMGLAAVYYLIPKILGRPIHSYQLAQLGFWGLAIFASWGGMQKLMGGPLPAWMPAVGGAATIFMLMPVAAVAINHHLTTRGNRGLVQYSPTFRYTVFGAVAYTVLGVVAASFCFFDMGKITQLTHAAMGFQILAIYGFFSMTMFGAIYFIVPRLTGKEWPSQGKIYYHFWFSVYGTIALIIMHILGGMNQAVGAEAWNGTFEESVVRGATWMRGASLCWLFVIIANVTFLYHLAQMVLGFGREGGEPTLLGHPHDDEHETPAATSVAAH
jgi:cytochrome c oxidase cbb3-type subunit 1